MSNEVMAMTGFCPWLCVRPASEDMVYLELIATKCTVVTSCHGMSVFSIVSKVIVPKDKGFVRRIGGCEFRESAQAFSGDVSIRFLIAHRLAAPRGR